MKYDNAANSAVGAAAANYASNQAANVQMPGQTKPRPLESIATATQRVNNAIVGVQDFLNRWHGPQPLDASGEAVDMRQPYAGELERLESRIGALNEIG